MDTDAMFDIWVRRLGLGHWQIVCDTAPVIDDHPDAWAVCHVRKPEGHLANITLTDRALGADEEERETIIIHELLHIPLDEIVQYAEQHMPREAHAWLGRLVETYVADMTQQLYLLAHENV